MLNLLKQHFGYDTFRPLQEDIINSILAGTDTLVLMPTGGGKSLCFQLPALMLPGITLVISPLIALMKDQVDALTANGIPAAFINSSMTVKEQIEVMDRARSGDLKILYLAPERLASSGFSDFLNELEVSLLAIDEAHCISEWGHDFRPDYRNLRELRSKFPSTPVMALTATATPQVKEDILSQLEMQEGAKFISSFNRENLHYSVRPKNNSFWQLVDLLQSQKQTSAIVYCFSRKDTEKVADDLTRAGLTALAYHAGLDKKTRRETQENFIRDEVPIIVATIAFGMGIDKPDVRMVVHMDLPKTIESYYQETGRAGRDGLPSECVLFYTYADRRKQKFFIDQITDDNEYKLALTKLDEVIGYCQSDVCRRAELLEYFGETWEAPTCEACDNCIAEPIEETDATEIAQKILSAVLRTGERFGMAHVCDVLRGSRKKRIIELNHDKLSVHGIARETPLDALREYLHALKKNKYIEENSGDYPTLRVSNKGKTALVNKEKISLPVSEVIQATPRRKLNAEIEYNVHAFEKLRALRKEIADSQSVPPFVIFGDKTLHEMAYYFPSTLETLGQIFGVGQSKLESYGDDFLKCIKEHAQTNQLEEKPIPRAPQQKRNTLSRGSATLQQTKELLEQKLPIKEIAQRRGLVPGTIIQHIEKLIATKQIEDISYLKPAPEMLKDIQESFTKTKTTSLTVNFKHLNEKYSYNELKLARLFL